MSNKTTADQFNIGDKVEYKGQNATVVDHYGHGNYAIVINGQWLSVHRRELKLCQ